jgi:tRNA(fMet)-specific endonuclease VapC
MVSLSVTWLLDTNVVSEAMKPVPHPGVIASLARHEAELAIAAPVGHELRFGWLRMPAGQRRDAIGHFIQEVAGSLPVLPYDAQAARIHAELRELRERDGHPLPFVDGQIAAIAIACGATLVTRNTRDFEGLAGLRLADWFSTA